MRQVQTARGGMARHCTAEHKLAFRMVNLLLLLLDLLGVLTHSVNFLKVDWDLNFYEANGSSYFKCVSDARYEISPFSLAV